MPYDNKPPPGSLLDPVHPFVPDLLCLLLNEASGPPLDLASGAASVFSPSPPTWVAGPSLSTVAASSQDVGLGSLLSGATRFTVICRMGRRVSSGVAGWRRSASDSDRAAFELYSDGNAYVTIGNGSVAYAQFSYPNSDLSIRTFAVVYDGSQPVDANKVSVFVDGINRALTPGATANFPASLSSSVLPLRLGSVQNGTAEYTDGVYDQLLVYSRALPAGLIAAHAADPCGFVRGPSVSRFFAPAAGGGSVSVTATATAGPATASATVTPGTTVVGSATAGPATASASVSPGSGAPTTATFDYTHAGYSGQFADATGLFAYRRFDGLHSRVDFVTTGTALTLTCYASHVTSVEASVDGAPWFDITPGTLNALTPVTVFTGLADAAHTVAVRKKTTDPFYLARDSDPFSVTGTAPNCAADPTQSGTVQYVLNATTTDSLGRAGVLNNVRTEAGYAPTGTDVSGYPLLIPFNEELGSDASFSQYSYGGQVRFAATVTRIDVWTYLDGTKFSLAVDGVFTREVQTQPLNEWGWLTVSAGLDGTTEHTYGVVEVGFDPDNSGLGAAGLFAVRTTGGTGINTATQPAVRPLLAGFGDSIVANEIQFIDLTNVLANYDTERKWLLMLSEHLGCEFANLGLGSTTVKDFTGNLGTLSGSINVVTTGSGERRVSHDFGTIRTPAYVVVLYGTNDLGQVLADQGRPAESTSDFTTSYGNMLTAINTAVGSTVPVYCLGILPRSDFTATPIGTWNTALQAAISAVGTANLHYLDPSGWSLNGSGSDYTTNYLDGLHPNEAGSAVIASNVAQAISGSAWTVPTSVPRFSVSSGVYSGSQTVTVTDITPGSAVRWTTDGTIPTSSTGTVYSSPVSVPSTASLRAIAYKSGLPDSAVNRADITIVPGTTVTASATAGPATCAASVTPAAPAVSVTATATAGPATASATATPGTSAAASAVAGPASASATVTPGTTVTATATAGPATASASVSPVPAGSVSVTASATAGPATCAASATTGTKITASATAGPATCAASVDTGTGVIVTASATAGPATCAASVTPAGGTDPPLAADLLSAVKAAFLAAPVASLATGGIFYKLTGRRAVPPFVAVEEVSAALAYTSSTSKVHRTRLRFKVYADDGDNASSIGGVLKTSLEDQKLAFAGGFTGPFMPGDMGHRTEVPTAAGRDGWFFLVEFEVMVRRGS